jgi:hypothetical protein
MYWLFISRLVIGTVKGVCEITIGRETLSRFNVRCSGSESRYLR